ncbi:MAG: hypothetical protein M3209_01150 [Acidobacteriota bacterium]|nr:hypothetical protein [Acidobacteriota bacterium]
MKRKITLSIVFMLIVVLSALTISDSTQAQNNRQYVGDTGVVTLGQYQILRITVMSDGTSNTIMRFRRASYMQSACNGSVCKLELNDEDQFSNITIMPGEAVSIDIPNNGNGVRGIFAVSKPVRANALIINTMTGQVEGIIAILIA